MPEQSDLSRTLLVIAYAFPPVGGVGVQRVTKFVKYLPSNGWAASVLTVANPSAPLHDARMLDDVPGGTAFHRARTWEPPYAVKAAVASRGPGRPRPGALLRAAVSRVARLVLQPDAQILWAPGALRGGRRLLSERRHAAVFVTGPPFSTFLVAARLARRARLPLVLDYRDEWTFTHLNEENKRPGALAAGLQRVLERRVLRAARLVIATTRSSAEMLERLSVQAGSHARVVTLYNGYDPADFADPAPAAPAPGEPYRLVYAGTLWRRTSPAPLLSAVRELLRRDPDLAGRLELVFSGRATPEQEALLTGLYDGSRLTRHSFLEHADSVRLMRAASGLCVLEADLPGTQRVLPAKVFEYLAAGRPLLTIAPRGELWDLLAPFPQASCYHPRDTPAIANWLSGEIARQAKGLPAPDPGDASLFSRVRAAQELARLLDGLTKQ